MSSDRKIEVIKKTSKNISLMGKIHKDKIDAMCDICESSTSECMKKRHHMRKCKHVCYV